METFNTLLVTILVTHYSNLGKMYIKYDFLFLNFTSRNNVTDKYRQKQTLMIFSYMSVIRYNDELPPSKGVSVTVSHRLVLPGNSDTGRSDEALVHIVL